MDNQQQVTNINGNRRGSSHKGSTFRRYSVQDKLIVVAFAKQEGNRAAGRRFGVDEKCIREWRKKEADLEQQPKHRSRLPGGGRKGSAAADKHLEARLVEYVQMAAKKRLQISSTSIAQQAKVLWEECKHQQPDLPEFKASKGYVWSFLKRNHFVHHKSAGSYVQIIPTDPQPFDDDQDQDDDQEDDQEMVEEFLEEEADDEEVEVEQVKEEEEDSLDLVPNSLHDLDALDRDLAEQQLIFKFDDDEEDSESIEIFLDIEDILL